MRPAIGVEHGLVQLAMRQGEPGGPLVVESGQGATPELECRAQLPPHSTAELILRLAVQLLLADRITEYLGVILKYPN